MKEILKRMYGLQPVLIEKSSVGAGSDTYFVTCANGKYVVKYPALSEINHPELEPELCEYLKHHDIPCCRFLRNSTGEFLTSDTDGNFFHVQDYIEGRMYDWHEAPEWLLTQSAQMLGRIHTALKDYQGLPVGIGADFFQYMTPERAIESYENSLAIAKSREDKDIIADLQYRMELMNRFPKYEFDLDKLTCCATHGDFFISQLLCGDGKINAVIDWTTACVHPVIWEITRSYVYAASSCKNGEIDRDGFVRYASEYLKFAALNDTDLSCMVSLFYYQIAVCDYYGQYYASAASNRYIYLRQAIFSTKLLRWLERHDEIFTCLEGKNNEL